VENLRERASFAAVVEHLKWIMKRLLLLLLKSKLLLVTKDQTFLPSLVLLLQPLQSPSLEEVRNVFAVARLLMKPNEFLVLVDSITPDVSTA